MRSLLFRAFGRPAGFAVGHLMRLSGRPLAVALMYHRVADRPGDPGRELVPAHAANLFERQLKHLRRAYRLVPASQLVEEARRRRRGGRIPLAVTFDDDHPCLRAEATPALARERVPATFFLSGASLEGPFSFWWERLQRAVDRRVTTERIVSHLAEGAGPPPERADGVHAVAAWIEAMEPERRDAAAERLLELAGPDPDDAGMRSGDVRALAEAGFEIGFHTQRHYRLTGLDDERLKAAMSEGRESLERLAGDRADAIAYPHGKADERVAAAARAAGFRVGFTSLPGVVTTDDDPLLLGRLEPSFASPGHLAAQVAIALLRERVA